MSSDSKTRQCVVAEYELMEAADVGMQVLETAGFDNESVSVIARGSDQSISDVAELEDDSRESPPTGSTAGVGAAVGGALGGALGASTLIGPFMVAGPLAGMAVGGGIAGLLGATPKWGLTEDVTRTYQQRVADGHVVIIVTDGDTALDEAERLLKTTAPVSLERFSAEQ